MPILADKDRPLNARGLRDAPVMAQWLRTLTIGPDRIISSPATRAKDTAAYFAAAFGANIEIEHTLYEASPATVMALLQALDDKEEVVFLFGHNPTFEELAQLFSRHRIEQVPTCGMFRVDAEVAHWKDFSAKTGRLVAFHFPKQRNE